MNTNLACKYMNKDAILDYQVHVLVFFTFGYRVIFYVIIDGKHIEITRYRDFI